MPRFKICSGSFDIIYDEAYMERVELESTVDAVETKPDHIYGFFDEVGNEALPAGESLFGVSGCVFIGTVDRDGFDAGWWDLRRRIFKVPDNKPYHSTRHFKKLKSREHKSLAKFLQSFDIKYVSSFMRVSAPVTRREDILSAVIGSVSGNINQLFGQTVAREEWYFEHSSRLNPKLITSQSLPHYNRANQRGGINFVRKSTFLPAIELADLISFVVGDTIRREPKKPIYSDILDALFGDESRGRSSEVLAALHAFIPAARTD